MTTTGDLHRPDGTPVPAVAPGEDLQTTLERIVESAAEVLDSRFGALVVQATAESEPLVASLGEDDPESFDPTTFFSPNQDGTVLSVPVLVRNEVVGHLHIGGRRSGETFTAHDQKTLAALASAAAGAIANTRLFADAARREQWLRASTEVTTAILSGADTEEVLDLVAGRVKDVANADGVAIMIANEDGSMVVEAVAGDASGGLRGMRDENPWSRSREALRSRKPAVIPDLGSLGVSDDPEYLRLGACLLLPLVAFDRTLGAIAVANDRGRHIWNDDDVTLGEAFAGQTAVALVLAEAQREQERLAVYVDRDRIARDLHDLVIQRLFATGMTLQGARKRGEVPTELDGRITGVIEELDATVREIRQTIFALNQSDSVKPSGVRARVLRELTVAGPGLDVQPRVRFEGPLDSLVSDAVADNLMAALREGLSNVGRHARASQIDVVIRLDGDDVVLEVIDDGVGIFPGGRRSGLQNLENRATDLGGRAYTEAMRADGSGTRLVWRAPAMQN